MQGNLVSSDAVFDPVQLGERQKRPPAPALLPVACCGSCRRATASGWRGPYPAARTRPGWSPCRRRRALGLPGAYSLPMAINSPAQLEFSRHWGRPGVRPYWRQVLLPLHEAAEDLLEVLHILVGGGGRILEIAVQGRLRHRQAPGVAEILHQEQLVFQIGALIAEMESVKNLCGEQIAPDESIEHRLGQPVPSRD